MDDFSRLLTLALAILAIATAAGFGLQRGRISSLNGRLREADEELVRKERRLAEAETKVVKLEADLEALAQHVRGDPHWVAIGVKLDDHHSAAETHWSHDENLLAQIRDRLPDQAGGGS